MPENPRRLSVIRGHALPFSSSPRRRVHPLMKPIVELLNEDRFFKALFEAIPCGVLVVDSEGRVQAVNDVITQTFGTADRQIVQKLAGEALGCVHAVLNPEGCGHSEACESCQVRNAAHSAVVGDRVFRHRTEMALRAGADTRETVLLVSAAPVDYAGQRLAIVVLEDITELSQLRQRLKTEQSLEGIVARDEKMLELFDTIREVAEVNVPVLVQGESGTGKELVAAAIHNEGPRAGGPFIAVNCGALPDSLLESELFGHVKGAFTGAIRDKKGRFELADGGTIFLDEVADLSTAMQVKLLRVLQEGTFERVGGEDTAQVDVRVISATNRDLRDEVAQGRFREDLFYRLCVVPVTLPPLRERPNDIPVLAEHFLARAAEELGLQKASLTPEALSVFVDHSWPGNVRELQNAVQFAMIKCKGQTIEPGHLPASIGHTSRPAPRPRRRQRKLNAAAVAEALRKTGGNKVKSAEQLGVARATLYRFMADEKSQG